MGGAGSIIGVAGGMEGCTGEIRAGEAGAVVSGREASPEFEACIYRGKS